jgi:ribonuclease P protein component
MKNYTFSKQERLCNRNDFQRLFSEGKSFYCYPFKCVYLWKDEGNFSAKIAISASKKKFKHAVDRNKIKRLIRENYRLKKELLYQKYANTPQSIDILIIYTETKILSFSFLQKKIIELIIKIIKNNDVKKTSFFEENLKKTNI